MYVALAGWLAVPKLVVFRCELTDNARKLVKSEMKARDRQQAVWQFCLLMGNRKIVTDLAPAEFDSYIDCVVWK